jgi:hypothetical protein
VNAMPKNSGTDSYKKQIDDFFNKKLRSDELIRFGMTPEKLTDIGIPSLPLVMKQSSLRKCTRDKTGSRSAHEIGRDLVLLLPELIGNPIAVSFDAHGGKAAMLVDAKDKNGFQLLLAIKTEAVIYGNKINEVQSFYGKEHLRAFFEKASAENKLMIIDKEKTKELSLTIEP